VLMRSQTQQWLLPVCVAVVMIMLMQFALDEPAVAREVMPRLYSVIAILVMFLVPDTLFKSDFMTGYLHQYALSPKGFFQAILARLVVQGLWLSVPLLSVLMLFMITTDIDATVNTALMISLVLLIPILFLMAALSSALTITLPQSSLLSMVMLMPLVASPLIIAQSMVMHAQMGAPFLAEIYLLLAIMIAACVALPWLIVWLLRNALG
jgi:heme exporter protein B